MSPSTKAQQLIPPLRTALAGNKEDKPVVFTMQRSVSASAGTEKNFGCDVFMGGCRAAPETFPAPAEVADFLGGGRA
jgi:hypothetical protein